MDMFAQSRTHLRARRLAISQLACLGRHTVTGLISVGGRQGQDWSADYRFFSRSPWDAQNLFDPVLAGICEHLPPGEPFYSGMDDTLLRKTGTKIPGVAYRRDPLSPAFHTNFVRGQRFLQVSGMLPAGDGSGPARAIPIRYEHVPPVPKPPHDASEEQRKEYRNHCRKQNLSTAGAAALARTRANLDGLVGGKDRLLVNGVDGSYTNKTVLRNLPERTVLIGRIRKDAKLFHPPVPTDHEGRGPKPRYGTAAPTPKALEHDDSAPWQEVRAYAAGKIHTFRVKTIAPVLWPKAGPGLPLRLVVVEAVGYRLRKGSKLLYRQPAYLICTDVGLALEKVLQGYLWRWDVEVNHRDEKQLIGVGEAQVRSPDSALRDPTFGVACYAKLLLAGALTYGVDATDAEFPLPMWRRNGPPRRVTTGDLVAQLRQDLWGGALKWAEVNYGAFAVGQAPVTKCPQINLSLAGAVAHAATG